MGQGNDTLLGSAADNRLEGGGGADVLRGRGGDDVLVGGAGDDALDGGAGKDTAIYAGLAASYRISDSGGVLTVTGGLEGGTDTLTGVETLRFADGTLTFDPGAAASDVLRLYFTVLARAPDTAGVTYFTHQIDRGAESPLQVAGHLLGSAEFQSRVGTLSTVDYVQYLYHSALHRDGDQGGTDSWVSAIDSGGKTRADVALAFSDSQEHVEGSLVGPAVFHSDADTPEAQVIRLFQTVLDRTPDVQGLTHFSARLASGAETLAQAAADMLASAEYLSAHAGSSDSAYVGALYHNALGRTGSTAEIAGWTALLSSGAETRGQVAVDISEGAEHKSATSLGAGLYFVDATYQAAASLYDAALGRRPDVFELIVLANELKIEGVAAAAEQLSHTSAFTSRVAGWITPPWSTTSSPQPCIGRQTRRADSIGQASSTTA